MSFLGDPRVGEPLKKNNQLIQIQYHLLPCAKTIYLSAKKAGGYTKLTPIVTLIHQIYDAIRDRLERVKPLLYITH